MVDLFNAKGELPRNLDEVGERQKDVTYASSSASPGAHAGTGELRQSLTDLLAQLPPKLKESPEARKLATLCDDREWRIARLTNPRLPYGSQTKDFEFSRATVLDHWAAGLEGMRKAIPTRDVMDPAAWSRA